MKNGQIKYINTKVYGGAPTSLAQPQTLPKKIGLCPKSKRAKRKGVGGKEFLPFCD